MILAGLALVGAVLGLWQSLRVAFGATDPWAALSDGGSVERQALEDEKAAVLRNLQDLKFEWQIGKLSDEDYRSQESTLRARAREVMRLLDADVEPFREEARELLKAPPPDKSASGQSPYRERGRSAKDTATKTCESCGATNDADADFCKKCGAHLGEEAPAGTEPSPLEAAPSENLAEDSDDAQASEESGE